MSQSPVVIDIAYKDDGSTTEQRIDGLCYTVDGLELSPEDKRYLEDFPTVYVIRSKEEVSSSRTSASDSDQYMVYVGETNSIARRTSEHYSDERTYHLEENRRDWKRLNGSNPRMLVIGHEHFNKSLTLDLENNLMSYVLASDAKRIRLINSRGNPQENYYTHDQLPKITSQVWRKLNRYESDLFPAESVIRDSAIFKASPFHKLGKEQLEAENVILGQVRKALKDTSEEDGRTLVLVEGVAGTGKTVLLSHLFLQMENEFAGSASEGARPLEASLLVNHKEQLVVYNSIMRRLGIQSRDGEVVKSPTAFINQHSESGHGNGLDRQDYPASPIDVTLVDEAHLLLNQGNQGYRGSRNMLLDIMRRSRVVVAVYDPNQILRHSQEVSPEVEARLFPKGRVPVGKTVGKSRTLKYDNITCKTTNILLERQFRIDACEEVIAWIDDFASGRGIGPIPKDTQRTGHVTYSIEVLESPFALQKAITERTRTIDRKTGVAADGTKQGLSRVLATYDWDYSSESKPDDGGAWEVRILQEKGSWIALDNHEASTGPSLGDPGRYFHMPWNYQVPANGDERDSDKAWAEQEHTLDECGSIYTIQGFDLNYAGVIIGPSVKYRDGRVVFDPKASCNSQAIRGSDAPEENLKHELNVLLKRGVHGLYLFAVDSGLEGHLLKMSRAPRA